MILLVETPASSSSGSALVVELSAGLIGLGHLRHFEIAAVEKGWPFLSLKSIGEEQWSFLVLEPGGIVPGYVVELADEDADALELFRAEDALVFNIVTVHSADPQHATVNLVGPLIVNRHTLVGKQVIIGNSEQYSTHHPLVDERHAAACAA